MISGIKTKEEVMNSAYEGADALGFVIGSAYRDSDEISIEKFKDLLKYIPVFVTPVILTHFTSLESILSIIEKTKTVAIQVNQNVDSDVIRKIKSSKNQIKIFKEIFLKDIKFYEKEIRTCSVFDVLILNLKGINGIRLNEVKKLIDSFDIPVMISNAPLDFLKEIRPYGVCLKEEIKGHNGFHNFDKVRQLINDLKGLSSRNYFALI